MKHTDETLQDVAEAVHLACVEMMQTHCPTNYEAEVLKRVDVKRIVSTVLHDVPEVEVNSKEQS